MYKCLKSLLCQRLPALVRKYDTGIKDDIDTYWVKQRHEHEDQIRKHPLNSNSMKKLDTMVYIANRKLTWGRNITTLFLKSMWDDRNKKVLSCWAKFILLYSYVIIIFPITCCILSFILGLDFYSTFRAGIIRFSYTSSMHQWARPHCHYYNYSPSSILELWKKSIL